MYRAEPQQSGPHRKAQSMQMQPDRRSNIQLLRSLVTSENQALILLHILVPQLSSLAVERTRAKQC